MLPTGFSSSNIFLRIHLFNYISPGGNERKLCFLTFRLEDIRVVSFIELCLSGKKISQTNSSKIFQENL
jgi:hypothetical protein